jgi:CBS domain-containing protein
MATENTANPLHHAANVERMLRGIRQHIDEDLARLEDERACALFDSARGQIDELIASLEAFQQRSGMWRDGMESSAAQPRATTRSVADVMTANVDVVRPDDMISDAAAKMAEADIGFLPVCDGERIAGALTDRDITVRAVARGRDPARTPVREIMTPEITYCYQDEDVEKTARLMREERIRRVIVVDRDKRLVGVVSLGDLAQRHDAPSADVLEAVSAAPPNG